MERSRGEEPGREGIKAWLRGSEHRGSQTPEADANRFTIAILPFSNISPDPADEYFADGLTEELTLTVSKINELSVISRTSSMQYKGNKTKSVKDISKELGAGTVLEGSVRKNGSRIRVTVQMIDATSDKHIWSENFDREFQDIFEIQSNIALRIASELKIKLVPDRQNRIQNKSTPSAEAHERYLRGRHNFNKFTKEGLEESLRLYQKALDIDPDFALAYEGMADSYLWLGFLNFLPEKQAYPKAREFAEKALQIDDSLAESHYILARTLVEYYWALSTGEAEFIRSIELDPSNARAHLYYSWLLASRLQKEKAVSEAEQAIQLDPNSAETWWSGSYAFYLIGEFNRAIEFGRKSIELNPLDPNGHMLTSFGLAYSGMSDEGVREVKEATALAYDHPYYKSNLAFVYAFTGNKEEATRILKELVDLSKTQYVTSLFIAAGYAALGDRDTFFVWFDKALEERSAYLVYTPNDPWTYKSGVHSDPRFKARMEKIGLRVN